VTFLVSIECLEIAQWVTNELAILSYMRTVNLEDRVGEFYELKPTKNLALAHRQFMQIVSFIIQIYANYTKKQERSDICFQGLMLYQIM
jgi:hypothetical protein